MRRQCENILITIFMICSLIFNYIAKTKTLEYPEYNIKFADLSILQDWTLSLAFAFVISILAVFILKIIHKNVIKERQFIRITEKIVRFSQRSYVIIFKRILLSTIIIFLATAIFCLSFVEGYKFRAFIYILQQIINASYILICYEIANIFHKIIFPQERAVVLYFLVHFMLVIFCSWIDYAKVFYLNPVNIIWQVSAFTIVYIKIFKASATSKEKLRYFTIIVSVQTLLFSLQRITQIVSSIYEPSGINWLTYRGNVFQALLTGDYPKLEDITLLNLENFHMIWLGIAFEKWQQMLFLALFVLFMALFIFMYLKHKNESLLSTLILGVIVSNVLGFACEINLFYSVKFGVMTSGNLFQIIPLICIIYLNRKGGYSDYEKIYN